MTDRQTEALKLALEALEEVNKLSVGENAICLPAEIDTAMDAIREALAEQPAQRKPLTPGEIAKALAGAGLRPEDYREDGMMEPLVRAIEAAHGIKGDA